MLCDSLRMHMKCHLFTSHYTCTPLYMYTIMAVRFVLKPRTFQNLCRHVFKPPSSAVRSASVDSRYFYQGSAEDIQLSRPVQLAGRKYLPGSFVPGFPKQLSSPREGFPLVLKARTDTDLENKSVEFWSECFKEQISEFYKEFLNGNSEPVAVLVRGLPIKTIKDFSRFVKGLNFKHFLYQGGLGIRDEAEDFVLTGAGEPKEFSIELHNEMSYSTDYPSKFIMTCLKKSLFGGETAICNGRELTANIDADLKAKFEQKGIRYMRYIYDESECSFYSWQRSLMIDDRKEAEKFLTDRGYSFKWDVKNLIYWNDTKPTINHPLTGEKIWFNQAYSSNSSYYKSMPVPGNSELTDEKSPYHTIHADGDAIDADHLHQLRCTSWNTAVGMSLEESDVLFLDNLAVLHSRMSYDGDRVIATSLLK